jgi:hypothetical protein
MKNLFAGDQIYYFRHLRDPRETRQTRFRLFFEAIFFEFALRDRGLRDREYRLCHSSPHCCLYRDTLACCLLSHVLVCVTHNV